MLHAEVRAPDGLLPEERDAWRAFQGAEPAFASPLLSPQFALAVGRVRDDARVAVFRRGGEIVGLFAHHRRPSAFGGAFARGLGGPWSDEQALLTGPQGLDWREAFAAAGLRACRFTGLIDPFGVFDGAVQDGEGAYAIAFDGPAEAYLEGLRAASPKRFKNLRRLESKLEREAGAVTLAAPDRDPQALDALIAWKRDQFRRTGVHDVLHPAWSRRLIADAFAETPGGPDPLLVTLRVDGAVVAGHFGLLAGAVYHPWIAAFDPAFAAYSPGIVLLLRAIRAMPELGLSRYELSGGCGHYKAAVASQSTPLKEGLVELKRAPAAAGRRRPLILERARRRLDRIVETELTFSGRLIGVAGALHDLPRRLPATTASAPEES
jgi:CelD/BcsL family acetyltransferase involved in cellulose biosynthesis